MSPDFLAAAYAAPLLPGALLSGWRTLASVAGAVASTSPPAWSLRLPPTPGGHGAATACLPLRPVRVLAMPSPLGAGTATLT
eukprot:2722387-Alexandrium_andersonii.AAC.1